MKFQGKPPKVTKVQVKTEIYQLFSLKSESKFHSSFYECYNLLEVIHA